MKAVWTPTGGGAITLADDANMVRMKIEQLGAMGVEQIEQLAFSPDVFRTMRGNIAGDLVFTAQQSFASRDAAGTYYKARYAEIGETGSMVITIDVVTMTMANATWKGCAVALFNGLEWVLRYTFGITTLT